MLKFFFLWHTTEIT